MVDARAAVADAFMFTWNIITKMDSRKLLMFNEGCQDHLRTQLRAGRPFMGPLT